MRPWLILISLAHADVALPASLKLVGPFASTDELCQEVVQRSETIARPRRCLVGPRTEHAAVVRVLDDPRFGRADAYLAVRTAEGWFVDEDLPDFKHNPQELLLHDNLRYTFRIAGLEEHAGTIILRAVHALFTSTEHPYTCVGLEVRCRGRSCGKPIVTSRKSACHPQRGGYWPAASATALP